jgi:hypothetical protein
VRLKNILLSIKDKYGWKANFKDEFVQYAIVVSWFDGAVASALLILVTF